MFSSPYFNLPNLLSFSRIPLAFVFLSPSISYRCLALAAAVITDVFDGYIARGYRQKSQLGAVIDPIADKFFVLFVLVTLLSEGQMTFSQLGMMLSRDIAVFVYGWLLFFKGNLQKYRFRSIISGKITTSCQFAVILALICRVDLPAYVYPLFMLLGFLAFMELLFRKEPSVLE